MPIKFKILGSGSSGNCALLQGNNKTILIDVGFSGKKIQQILQCVDLTPEHIDAVFLTHEHSDHSMGVRGLARFPNIRFFTNTDTAQALQKNLSRAVNWHIFETGTTFQYDEFEVTTFSIPHDAYDPVGYVFKIKTTQIAFDQHHSLAWVTDLGYMPMNVQKKIRDVDILVLECNYDTEMLDADFKRPWSVKQRIKGRHGHLSNHDAYEFITNTAHSSWKKIYLAHLSRDCNNIQCVERLFSPFMHADSSFQLEIIDPESNPINKLILA